MAIEGPVGRVTCDSIVCCGMDDGASYFDADRNRSVLEWRMGFSVKTLTAYSEYCRAHAEDLGWSVDEDPVPGGIDHRFYCPRCTEAMKGEKDDEYGD